MPERFRVVCTIKALYKCSDLPLPFIGVGMGATTGGRESGPPQNLDGPPKFLHSFLMNSV